MKDGKQLQLGRKEKEKEKEKDTLQLRLIALIRRHPPSFLNVTGGRVHMQLTSALMHTKQNRADKRLPDWQGEKRTRADELITHTWYS